MPKLVDKVKLKGLLEPHFIESLTSDEYEVKTIKAKSLLTSTRFDLAFKLLYLDLKSTNIDLAKELYKKHIEAFHLGKVFEPGNARKNSIERFIEEFDSTSSSISRSGFDSFKSLIPLSINGSIANGAHRVASAIYADRNVEVVDLDVNNHIYDYQFFYQRNVSEDKLDIAAIKYVEYAENIYVALIWPTAQGYDDVIENIIPNIVYRKDVTLAPNGAHNLLSQIYHGEEWLGSAKDNFKGSRGKLVECFKTFSPVRIFAFQAERLESVLKIKEAVRRVFDVGKHSIHITDTKEEAVHISKLLFNDNSIHLLNYGFPNKYSETQEKLQYFKYFLSRNKLSAEDVVLDSSIVLSIYGLRKCRDIDYLSLGQRETQTEYNDIDNHIDDLEFHRQAKEDLILDPKFYFYYDGLKFISFSQLYEMKKHRGSTKDLNDVEKMSAFVGNNRLKQLVAEIKQKLYFLRLKAKLQLMAILKLLGIYKFVRFIYRKLN